MPDAESLRRVVLEPWCPKCGCPVEPKDEHTELGRAVSGLGHDPRPPLWTRWPQLRPQGLEWKHDPELEKYHKSDPHFYDGWAVDDDFVFGTTAHALICWSMARELAKAIKKEPESRIQRAEAMPLIDALASDNPAQELAAMCHRLKDQENADV